MQYENNFFNLLLFAPTIFMKTNANDSAYFSAQRKQGRPIYRQLRAEMCVYVGLQIIIAYHDPWKWLMIFWIPHLLGKYGIITMNMLQHDGCDENHRFNHSRNFTDPFLNFVTSNNGYHTIHHMYPGKHWSRLKDEHEKVLTKPPCCVCVRVCRFELFCTVLIRMSVIYFFFWF